MKKFLLVVVVMGICHISYGQNFRAQQKAQEKAIRAAYKKGRVTEVEYDKLMKEQLETLDKFYADGYLDASEKNKIHDKLDRAERRLRRYKRNGEVY